jgi:hypothetical protein
MRRDIYADIKPLPGLQKLYVFGSRLPSELLRAAHNLTELGGAVALGF